jgi:hypothetical protein
MEIILVGILLQFVGFIPFYMIWRNDCKTIGKENLAVPLKERFTAWLLFCPFWTLGFFK